MSSIQAIAIKNRPRVPMQPIDSATITVANGILGDFRGGQLGRQITILSEDTWNAVCAELDADLPWTTRRANLLIDGVEFSEAYLGRRLHIGEVELVVTEETAPCSNMDAQHAGLTAALTPDWRGGICCNVVKGGDIKTGDTVEFA